MIAFRVDRTRNRLVAIAVGGLTRECLSGHWSAVEDAAPEVREFDPLCDFRDVRAVTVSTGVLRSFNTLPEKTSEGRIPVVAGTSVVFGTGRMFQALSEKKLPDLRVFRWIDEALGFSNSPIGATEPTRCLPGVTPVNAVSA